MVNSEDQCPEASFTYAVKMTDRKTMLLFISVRFHLKAEWSEQIFVLNLFKVILQHSFLGLDIVLCNKSNNTCSQQCSVIKIFTGRTTESQYTTAKKTIKYNSAQIIKIDQDFSKLCSKMYCHVFMGHSYILLAITRSPG